MMGDGVARTARREKHPQSGPAAYGFVRKLTAIHAARHDDAPPSTADRPRRADPMIRSRPARCLRQSPLWCTWDGFTLAMSHEVLVALLLYKSCPGSILSCP